METRTPGLAGSPGKPTGSNPGRAPRADPTLHHQHDGGPTSVTGCALYCQFHHDIAIHRWGWQITRHPDGTSQATSPDGRLTLHSHGPPTTRAG